jgi:transposase-like protein
MPAKKYHVELSVEQRADLGVAARSNKLSTLERRRARILLRADEAQAGGGQKDEAIARAVSVSLNTVGNVRRRWSERAVAVAAATTTTTTAAAPAPPTRTAVRRREQLKRKLPKLDGPAQAHLVAAACAAPPDGRKRWTLNLLAGRLIEQKLVDSISGEAVRVALKKTRSNRG